MKNEIFAYDYIIALLEAAKKATKKLKKRKIRRVLEEDTAEEEKALGVAVFSYIGDSGILRAYVKRIKELTGTPKTQELYALLRSLAGNADKHVKPENLYLLKPVLDVMRNFVEKCEKLEKKQAGEQKQLEDQKPVSLLENLGEPTKEQCEKSKDLFSMFIKEYEATKKDIPFYKRWYYWFMSLPMWKRILIGFMFVVVLFIILLAIFKVGSKVVAALKRAANGNKVVGRKLVNAASNANPRIKNAAFAAVMDAMPKRVALYF